MSTCGMLYAPGMTEGNVTQSRIQGLVTGGAAQVHVNGHFANMFQVTRGVIQVCPVAPLLFAMVIQPLMRMLRDEEAKGRLMGINYDGQKTLLHYIYADIMRVNLTIEEAQFNRLREVIQVFEGISGARLNFSKSLIMPICPSIPQEWVNASGSRGVRLLGWQFFFLYLGITTSNPVNEGSGYDPVYQMLSVGIDTNGLDALQTSCRHFLWGWVDQYNPKASMVAWEHITQGNKTAGWDEHR
ncbi:hypothetical protein R1sor_019619 [Riccia sorocarpa]|uniref:Reverse transcriptase domain-containing protein n=1 Tax=Riccia sorocarpa TaxID=122646 RepID=A0ABD3ID63_9MARC